ncbi:hypothetical protein RDABS01_014907 [Bienertia sinuspersici]
MKYPCNLASDINHTNFCPSSNIQLPWLMLADSPTSSYRRFYILRKGMYRKIDLPHFADADDYRRYFSSKRWLIAVSRRKGLITFYDPFSATGTVINPPTMPFDYFYDGDLWDENSYTFQFGKFIFSTDARKRLHTSSTCDDDMQVAMLFNTNRSIAFWRPGKQHWIRNFETRQIDDVCFFRGIFYFIDDYTQVVAFGNPPRIVIDLRTQGLVTGAPIMYYIVPLGLESASSLLVVSKYLDYNNGELYWTEGFELFEVNVDKGTATQVHDIGNRALFIGHNSTFFVEASPSHKYSCRHSYQNHDPNLKILRFYDSNMTIRFDLRFYRFF